MHNRVVLVRHGESVWNAENRWSGWTNVDLSEKGRKEVREAAAILAQKGYTFDVAYTSVLKRAIRTLWCILEGLDLTWIPIYNAWELNERHYGALQGLSKAEAAAKFGDEQLKIWRRSYDVPPPPLTPDDERFPARDPRYSDVPPDQLPLTECMKDTVERVLPYWNETIVPQISAGKRVIIAAHGNSLRALVKHLDNMSFAEIMELNIPTGVPLVYEFDQNLKAVEHYYLGDQAEIAARMEPVARQGTAKR